MKNALTMMLREVWAYEQMHHRTIGEYSYLACLLEAGEMRESRFPSLNHSKRRASRWAGRIR